MDIQSHSITPDFGITQLPEGCHICSDGRECRTALTCDTSTGIAANGRMPRVADRTSLGKLIAWIRGSACGVEAASPVQTIANADSSDELLARVRDVGYTGIAKRSSGARPAGRQTARTVLHIHPFATVCGQLAHQPNYVTPKTYLTELRAQRDAA